MSLIWSFQKDNDFKYTSGVVTEWIQSIEVHVLKWPGQSLDLNHLENPWELIDHKILTQNYIRKEALSNYKCQ